MEPRCSNGGDLRKGQTLAGRCRASLGLAGCEKRLCPKACSAMPGDNEATEGSGYRLILTARETRFCAAPRTASASEKHDTICWEEVLADRNWYLGAARWRDVKPHDAIAWRRHGGSEQSWAWYSKYTAKSMQKWTNMRGHQYDVLLANGQTVVVRARLGEA